MQEQTRRRVGRVTSGWLVRLAIDSGIAAASLPLAVLLRVQAGLTGEMQSVVLLGAPVIGVLGAVIFALVGLPHQVWRHASVRDLSQIIRAVTITIAAFVLVMFALTRLDEIPRSTPVIQWFMLITMLGGVRLVARRWNRDRPKVEKLGDPQARVRVLLLGAGDETAQFLRALQRDRGNRYDVVGIIDSTGANVGDQLHGVRILGRPASLRGIVSELAQHRRRPEHLIVAEAPMTLGVTLVEQTIRDAEALGLQVFRLPSPTELRRGVGDGPGETLPVQLTDLLSRPQQILDRQGLDRLISGRAILITGAGGTIGSEITLQVAALRPARLVLADFSEFNLYMINLQLEERMPEVPRVLELCNIRERERVERMFERHRPEIVFHAAALKHVPMVEMNSCEGVLTNVVGTRNVADAARRAGVAAFVQVSSDKAVNPTSVMGATKRLGELYCQALDLKALSEGSGSRFMTVRFGNVLGSSGSLIPLFERQLKAGGPLTVTHPEIKRYFMTVREAVELVLQASGQALTRRDGVGLVFVVDMGEPVRIIDLARRMIRLAGLVPDVDVKIQIVGLRPGEKLYEELFDHAEETVELSYPGVLGARPVPIPLEVLADRFEALNRAAEAGDAEAVRSLIQAIIPCYPFGVVEALETVSHAA